MHSDLLAGSHSRSRALIQVPHCACISFRLEAMTRSSSERDDAVSLLHRRHALQDFIDRAVLQGSHSQINSDPAQDITGDLLKDQVAQLLARSP